MNFNRWYEDYVYECCVLPTGSSMGGAQRKFPFGNGRDTSRTRAKHSCNVDIYANENESFLSHFRDLLVDIIILF